MPNPDYNDLGQPIGVPIERPTSISPPQQTLRGRYCEVVPLDVEAHGQGLFEAYAEAADDGDWTYLSYGPFHERDPFIQWLSGVEDGKDPMFYTIVDAAGAGPVGLASYLRIEPGGGSIEVGHIHLSRRLQRTPAATEAMFLLMRNVFQLGYRRYEWKCDDLNAPSRAAARRLGFRYEGTFRKATHYKGRNRDTAWFSIVDDEWSDLEPEFVRWLDTENFDEAGRQRSPLRFDR